MFEAVDGMREEHADLERRLSLPETHADQRLAKQLNQRYADLSAVVSTWQEWRQLGDDAPVGEVGEERLELPGGEHALVDEGPARQAREVRAELALGVVAADRRGLQGGLGLEPVFASICCFKVMS